jgi:hypothetical protein
VATIERVLIKQHSVTALDIVTPQFAYILGISFGVPLLETQNHEYVVAHFQRWLESPDGDEEWKMLMRWAEPTKIVQLIRDAANENQKTINLLNRVLDKVYYIANEVIFKPGANSEIEYKALDGITPVETGKEALTNIVEQNKDRPTANSNPDIILKVGHPVAQFKASMKPPISSRSVPEVVLQQFAAAQM